MYNLRLPRISVEQGVLALKSTKHGQFSPISVTYRDVIGHNVTQQRFRLSSDTQSVSFRQADFTVQ